MTDIAPLLLDGIKKDFKLAYDKNLAIKKILEMMQDGTATYKEANLYAVETGKILAKSYATNLSSAVLPDGKMYFNIADRVLNETLGDTYKLVAKASANVQADLNKAANIGIKSIEVSVNDDRIMGIINRIASEDEFDNVAWILDEPVVTLNQSAVFDTVKKNMEFQNESGLPVIVERVVTAGCCDWCKDVAGKYTYPDVPDEIYRGHDKCRCYVDFDVNESKGKRQTVLLQKSAGSFKYADEQKDVRIAKAKALDTKATPQAKETTKTLTKQYADTPAMNEYEYFEYDQKQFRLKSISELAEVSDAESRKILEALCGENEHAYGVGVDVPRGWFYKGDTAIRSAKSGEYFEKAKTIDSYIKKAPKYQGEIYRGLSLDDKAIEQFKKGGTFIENGNLSSWTSDKSVAQMFADGRSEELGTKQVIIRTSNHPQSTPAAHLSIFGSDEAEVLVSNMDFSEYLIENVVDEDGYLNVILKLKGN